MTTSLTKKTNEKDALVVIKGSLKGRPIVACAFEFGFMGGSLGSVVGERFVWAVNECIKDRIPLVCFSASGGARMQEGIHPLMQMARTTIAVEEVREAGLPYIVILCDPTTGGVSAFGRLTGSTQR